jgi:hypothetical protein
MCTNVSALRGYADSACVTDVDNMVSSRRIQLHLPILCSDEDIVMFYSLICLPIINRMDFLKENMHVFIFSKGAKYAEKSEQSNYSCLYMIYPFAFVFANCDQSGSS